MLRHLLIGWSILLGGLAATAWVDAPLVRFEFQEPHMGTIFKLVFYAKDEATAKEAARASFLRIAELDAIMSDYRPTSELMQLCKKAGGNPAPVSQELFDILQLSCQYGRDSGGAFDVTISPVVRLWRRARRTSQFPDKESLAEATKLVDYRNIVLDAKNRTVQLKIAGILLDLGGIAKGYTADQVLALLRQLGITRALVAAGGDVAVSDAPPDSAGWKVGIAPLKNPDATPTHRLLLKNAAVSTAGDSEQFVEIDGVRYSHIVDPKTGVGLVGRRSVSVIAKTGVMADALDTTVCILGKDRGMAFLKNFPEAEAILVFETAKGVETTATRGIGQYLPKGQ